MKTASLFVRSGEVISIGELPIELDGVKTAKRASSILPLNWFKLAAFVALRLLFGERGRVAEWTRGWHGPWSCFIYETKEYRVAQSRKVLLDWEHERLEELLSRN